MSDVHRIEKLPADVQARFVERRARAQARWRKAHGLPVSPPVIDGCGHPELQHYTDPNGVRCCAACERGE